MKPSISLGTLLFASQFIDLLWPTLLLLGVESVQIVPGSTAVTPLEFVHYPFSHSLLMVCVWGGLVGGIYWLKRKSIMGAVVLGFCVVSHWFLDLIVHRPDLPLSPGVAARVGFGLWDSLPGTLLVEGTMFAAGVFLYLRITRARNRTGGIGLWGLVDFLLLVHAVNLAGPPPPNTTAIAFAGHLQWLLIALGYWVDRHRVAREGR